MTTSDLDLRCRIDLGAKADVLCLAGTLTDESVPALRLRLADLIALDDHDLVVDVRDVTDLGEGSIAVLAAAGQHLARRGRALSLCAPSPAVRTAVARCGAAHLLGPAARRARRLRALVATRGAGRDEAPPKRGLRAARTGFEPVPPP